MRVGFSILICAALLVIGAVAWWKMVFAEEARHYHTDSEGTYDDRSNPGRHIPNGH